MSIEENHSVLRIEIQGVWNSGELAEFFSSLYYLYKVQFQLAMTHFFPDMRSEQIIDWFDLLERPARVKDRFFRDAAERSRGPISATYHDPQGEPDSFHFESHFRGPRANDLIIMPNVEIASIQYASPGFADFAGFGKVMEQIRKFLETLIKHRDEANLRVAQAHRYELENERIRIENARAFVSLAQQAGIGPIGPEDMARLLSYVADEQLPLAELIGAYKIARVKEIPYEQYLHKFQEPSRRRTIKVSRRFGGPTSKDDFGKGDLDKKPQ